MNEIGIFTPEQARLLWQDYLSRKQTQPQTQHNYPQHRERNEPVLRTRPAVIGSSLTAPSSSLVAATTCTIYFLDLQADGTQVLNPAGTTAYNDDPEVTAEPGTYCRVVPVNSRWMIMYLGCDTQSELIAEIPA